MSKSMSIVKSVFRGMLTALNEYIKNTKISNNLAMYFKDLEKHKHTKLQISRRKKPIKIKKIIHYGKRQFIPGMQR